MKLEVKELFFAPFGQKQNVAIELFSEQIEDDILAKRIKGELELTKLENEILAKFKVKALIKVVCDRCLSEYEIELPLTFSQEFIQGIPDDDEKIRIDNGFQINITEPIRQEIITRLPAKKLCAETCAGLCLNCGKNLNIEKCVCNSKVKSQKSK